MGKFKTLSLYLVIGLVVSVALGVLFNDTITEVLLRITIVELLEFIVWAFLYGDDE
jgi:undecaprenyl pyrophosphate phosphatase UppP